VILDEMLKVYSNESDGKMPDELYFLLLIQQYLRLLEDQLQHIRRRNAAEEAAIQQENRIKRQRRPVRCPVRRATLLGSSVDTPTPCHNGASASRSRGLCLDGIPKQSPTSLCDSWIDNLLTLRHSRLPTALNFSSDSASLNMRQ